MFLMEGKGIGYAVEGVRAVALFFRRKIKTTHHTLFIFSGFLNVQLHNKAILSAFHFFP